MILYENANWYLATERRRQLGKVWAFQWDKRTRGCPACPSLRSARSGQDNQSDGNERGRNRVRSDPPLRLVALSDHERVGGAGRQTRRVISGSPRPRPLRALLPR